MRSTCFAFCLVWAMLCWAALGLCLAADKPKPEAAEIARLIKQLGHEKFEEREAATKRLQEIGEPALAALREAAESSAEAEVRRRAARLLELIGRRVTAPKLVETFMTNEAYAEECFVGKPVEITGKVVRISVSKYGSPDRGRQDYYLLEMDLEGAGEGKKVVLDLLIFFDEQERKQLAEVKPGQTVTVIGECRGRIIYSGDDRKKEKDYSQVHVRNCRLVGAK